MLRKFLVIGLLSSQVSFRWRDGEVYPASLVISRRSGVTQTGSGQVACSEKSTGDISETVLAKNGVLNGGGIENLLLTVLLPS